jgi:hypothetical protein
VGFLKTEKFKIYEGYRQIILGLIVVKSVDFLQNHGKGWFAGLLLDQTKQDALMFASSLGPIFSFLLQ